MLNSKSTSDKFSSTRMLILQGGGVCTCVSIAEMTVAPKCDTLEVTKLEKEQRTILFTIYAQK